MKVLNYDRYIKQYSNCPKEVPNSLMSEKQSQKNHCQTLSRLNERGGCIPSEIYALMACIDWDNRDEGQCIDWINRVVAKAKQADYSDLD